MSGGTWDHDQFHLRQLADQIANPLGLGVDTDGRPLEGFDRSRALASELMHAVADMAHALDYHYAGDVPIHVGDDEYADSWVRYFQRLLTARDTEQPPT